MKLTATKIVYCVILSCLSIMVCDCLLKYDVHIDYFERPDRDLLFDYTLLRIKKFNRTVYTLDGSFEVLIPFSDDIYGVIDGYGYSGNEYRKFGQANITRMCHFIQNDKIIMNQVLNQTSMGLHPDCPLPLGPIYCNNLHLPTDRFTPMAWMARYRKTKLTVTYFLNGTQIATFSFYLVIEPIKLF